MKIISIILIELFLLFPIFSNIKNNDKVYLRIRKSNGIYYKYNKYNKIIKSDSYGQIFFMPTYERLIYLYFKNEKYIGVNSEDFDTYYEFINPLSSFPKNTDWENNYMGYGYIFNNNKLVKKAWATPDYNKVISRVDCNNAIEYVSLILNENGYILETFSGIDGFIDIYSVIIDGIQKKYIYNENKNTYDGKMQIKQIIADDRFDNNTNSIYQWYEFSYDRFGRIRKIEEKRNWYKSENKFYFYYIFYYKDKLFICKFDNPIKAPQLDIFCEQFNEYGYKENSPEFYISKEDGKIIRTMDYDKIYDVLSKIEFKKINKFKKFSSRYEKANPEYIDNLKLQITLLPNDELVNYTLGISSWFRYKYLNDITDDYFYK